MHRFIPFVVVALVGCKARDSAPPPAAPANKPVEAAPPAAPPAAAAAALPGSCVPIPIEGDPDATYDFDGDGVKDTVVQDLAQHCDKYECPRKVFVQRGTCGHYVGTVSVGYSASLTVLPSRSHGLADLKVEGINGEATYVFDGTGYVVKHADKIDPATDFKMKQEANQTAAIETLRTAKSTQDIARVLADQVTIASCKDSKLDRAHAATRLASMVLVYLSKRSCDANCCTFSAGPDEAPGGDVGALVKRVCANAFGVIDRVELQCNSAAGP
jgi:hypothetical protein